MSLKYFQGFKVFSIVQITVDISNSILINWHSLKPFNWFGSAFNIYVTGSSTIVVKIYRNLSFESNKKAFISPFTV